MNEVVRRASLALIGMLVVLGGVGVRSAWAQNTTNAPSVPSEPILRIEAGAHTASILAIDTDAAGRYAVTAGDDKTARIWDRVSGQMLRVLRPPIGDGNEGKLYTAAISPDGSTVATAGWTQIGSSNGGNTVYLFDRASGQLRHRLTGVPNVINHMSFSPDGRWLAIALGGSGGVRVWNWKDGETPLADRSYGASSFRTSWSRDGRLVVSCEDGVLRLYRVGPGLTKTAEGRATNGRRAFGIAFHPDGSRVALSYVDNTIVDVFDGNTLAFLFSPNTQGTSRNLGTVAWSRDGSTLLAAGQWYLGSRIGVRLWPNAGRGVPRDVPTSADTVQHAVPLPGGGWLLSASDAVWGELTPDGRWLPRAQGPMADLRDHVRGAFLLDARGTQVQFGFEPFGRQPHVFDLPRRSLRAGTLANGTQPDSTTLALQNWEHRTDPTLNGKPIVLQTNERARAVAVVPGGQSFVIGSDWSLRQFGADGSARWKRQVSGVTWGVNVPREGRVAVATFGDGTIRWHRLSDGQELLALFPHADRKRWVLWTPSGYYDASPGAEDLIGWHVNRGAEQGADFFPVSRLRSRYYRPDVIDRILDTLDEAVALKQADQAANRRQDVLTSVAEVLPPVVEVLSGLEVTAAAPQLTLRVRGRAAADAPVTAWRVRVNGQLVGDGRGLGRQDAPGTGGGAANAGNAAAAPGEREIVVAIPAQDSQVQVFAENRHGVSSPATVRVKWTGAAPAQPTTAGNFRIQPKLYVLAVGVASYQHADIPKLVLPAKDARDFAGALMRQKGRLYREVEVRLLTDAQATADSVVDGLDWLQKQVTQHDVGVVFIAGHGVNDPTQGYTFLPFNADPDRLRRTGVPMDEFRKTLAALPGKALFFFDTCHSGNVLGNTRARGAVTDVSGLINELTSAESGVIVFSSSTGRQLSYEDPSWGNGAFTKAVVEGLDGAADFQKNGRITHKMLDLYVSDRVKQLTGGKQSPVTQAPGGVPDFPVAVVK